MGEKITVKRQCSICKTTKEIQLTAEEYENYLVYLNTRSMLIQDALPDVALPDREMLRSMGGVCCECWNKYFCQPFEEDEICDEQQEKN